MDRSVKHHDPRSTFFFLGTDWIEWLIVVLLCVFGGFSVTLLSGSVLFGVATGGVLLCACSVVVALL